MNIVRVKGCLVIASQPGVSPAYDFDFDLNFTCDHQSAFDHEERCILRTGVVPDYDERYAEMLEWGFRLINSPGEHALASELEHWYPLLQDLTPRTQVFDTLPSVGEIEAKFAWPIFLKSSRQTSKHNGFLSIIEDAGYYEAACEAYRGDAVLHWQKPVVRDFIQLPVVSRVSCGPPWSSVPSGGRARALVGADTGSRFPLTPVRTWRRAWPWRRRPQQG